MNTRDLYKEHILDHYRNPRNYGDISDADVVSEEANLSCGDYVQFYLKFKGKMISDIKFKSRSCAICTASASMLSEVVKGKTNEFILEMSEDELLQLFGGSIDPQRLGCALLPLLAIKKGVREYERKRR